MGWLTGWTYRKNHFVNPASGAGQNYQKRIIVHFGTGTDSGEDVYLDGKCLADFGDIRFTSSTGVALLDYWMEKKVDSDYAIFWVKVTDDLSVYDSKIYIYYDNAGATSVANGDATFVFFDDFEIDLSKWQFVNNASISTDHAYYGSKCVKLEVVAGSSGQVGKLLTSYNVAIHTHYYDIESVEVECHGLVVSDGGGHDSAIGVVSDISQYEYMPDAFLPTPTNSGIDRTVGWHEFMVRCTPNLRQFFIDGILMPITTSDYANIFILTASNGGAHPATGKSYWDTVFITKFVYPEPIHGAWGIEETDSGGGITTFVAEDTIDTTSKNFLTIDEIPYSLPQAALIVEDIPLSLLYSLHIPISFEDILFPLIHERILIATDPLFSLLYAYHQSIPSEDIMLLLPAPRRWNVDIEFIEFVTEAASEMPVPLLYLAKKIIITTKGKILISR